MNTLDRCTVFLSAFLMLAPALGAQALPAAPSAPGFPPAPTSLEDRRKALAQVAHDYWEDVLKHSPELASALGDTRFNDQVTNYTPGAFNDEVAREQTFLMQLAVIDLAGFTEQEKQQQDALEQRFEEDQKAADSGPWKTPISASGSFYTVYPQLAQTLPFATVKDYDDWTTRLHLLPEAFSQIMQDMSLGINDGRVPTRDVLDKALTEISALGHQKAENSPLAAPLKKFPTSISATEQDRIKQQMLDAISNDAQAAFLRMERFLRASYIPAAGKEPIPHGTREAQILSEVLDARARTQQALGSKFDVRAFHDEMLRAGLLPIDQMHRQLEAWIAAGGK